MMGWMDYNTDKTGGMPTVNNSWSAGGAAPAFDFSSLANYGGTGAATGILDVPELNSGPMTLDSMLNLGKMGMNDLFKGFGGTRNADGSGTTGWGMPAISAAQGLMSSFLGMKNYGLAKDQFNFSKDMAQKNLANQTKMVNGQLEDRQRARVAANPTAYQSVDAYMKEKGI